MPRYYCFVCKEETGHFTVSRSAEIAQVTRATVYNWMKRSRLHCVVRPSGRTFICVNSLVRPKIYVEESHLHSHAVMPHLRVAAGM